MLGPPVDVDPSQSNRPPELGFRHLVLSAGWLSAANLATAVLGFLQTVVVARMLGVEFLGVLAIALTYTKTVKGLLNVRSWEPVTKFLPEFRERAEVEKASALVTGSYLVDFVTSVVAFAAVYLSAGWAAETFTDDPQAGWLIRVYALTVILSFPNSVAAALLRIADRHPWLALHTTTGNAARLVGVFILWQAGAGIVQLVYLYVALEAAVGISMLYLGGRVQGELELLPWSQSRLKSLRGTYQNLLGFTFYSGLSSASRLITSQADILLLGFFASSHDVGVYRVAKSVADPLVILVNPVYMTSYPILSRLVAREDNDGLASLTRKLFKSLVFVVILACAGVSLLAPWVLPGIFGSEFESAVLLVQIMIWQLIWVPLVWVPSLLLSRNRARLVATVNWFDAVAYLLLLSILITRLGVLGAAVATLARYVLWTAVTACVYFRVQRQSV